MPNNQKNWELFSCDTEKPYKDGCPMFVDMLSVDVKHRRFILDVHVDDRNTDGYYEDGSEVICTNLSRELLYILLEGLKRNGYKEYAEKEEK
ncbi:MAG: hypothetical protein LKK13_05395 [Bacilli bacterium]|jgi:hypothetical protein|nr:hypothetical protein [Bacilli bacterium]